ncbi:MAG: prolyl oligopeptidase family serine peptidase [Chitinophagaceae bacterium]
MQRLLLQLLLLPVIGIFSNAGGSMKEQVKALIITGKNSFSTDTLPTVLTTNRADLLEGTLRNQAAIKFGFHQLPGEINEWMTLRQKLKSLILEKAGVVIDHQLPLDIRETGTILLKGYSIKNIVFQTRPGVYATANLYIPVGAGPFPAVINMLGHWRRGKMEKEGPQPVGHSLALNGYVCLSIDPWGSGERTTVHGDFEYHGANLGASLMNIGETLAGVQIADNMRGIDLLASLSYVDPGNIGATGASGGGNQTMWLAAVDERVKAAMPVVSVGTFESYIMRSNCVCELLPDGSTFTEEAGVVALVAPRAIKMCNHTRDLSPTFFPSEMLRTFHNAKPVFKMLGVENNISYQVVDQTHGYWPEDREAMLGWFDLHLKGTGSGSPKKEIPFELLPEEKLMVYLPGKRDPIVMSTDQYCKKRGEELRTVFLQTTTYNAEIKKEELRNILRSKEKSGLKKIHNYTSIDGWDRMALETTDKKLIPLLHKPPLNQSLGYIIICDPKGKMNLSVDLLQQYIKKGLGIVVVDLTGTGEASSEENPRDKSMVLHTLSRSELWLGKTIMGEWVKELGLVTDLLISKYKAAKVGIHGSKEAGLAALFLSATAGKADYLILSEAPLSYLFDKRDAVDFFSMAIHLPAFLNWGDVSLAAALSGRPVTIINPVTMSGRKLTGSQLKDYQTEFQQLRRLTKQAGETVFN